MSSLLLEAAAPKSEQLNSCDFLVAPRTYTIRDVSVKKDGEQRVSVFFEEHLLPWKPCKSMLRVMMLVWKSFDGKDFVGKKVTLFNDENVIWAGIKVGGIRISHMSGLKYERSITLRASKSKSANYFVKPLEEKVKEEPVNASQVAPEVKQKTEAENEVYQRIKDLAKDIASGDIQHTESLGSFLDIKKDAKIIGVDICEEWVKRLEGLIDKTFCSNKVEIK